MQGLDLTPNEMRLGHQRHGRVRFWGLLAALALTLNAGWVGYHYWRLYQERQETDKLQEEQSRIEQRIQSLSQATAKLQQWENRLVVMDALRRFPNYPLLTGFLAQKSPDLLVLTRLEFDQEKSNQSVAKLPAASMPKSAALFDVKDSQAPAADAPAVQRDVHFVDMTAEGYARDYQIVADFMKLMRESGLIADCRLERTWRQPLRREEMVYFEITGRIVPQTAYLGYSYAYQPKAQNL